MPDRIDSGGNDDATTPNFPQRIYERWSSVREFLHGVKVAWVSVASVVVGALLFLVAPQVQDLFLEVTGNPARSVAFWLFFYLSVMIAWGLPVYVSSRWILSRFEQGSSADAFPDVKPVQTWVRREIPPLLALGCFVAALIGQLIELTNAPSLVGAANESNFIDRLCEGRPGWACGLLIWSKRPAVAAAQYWGSGTVILIVYCLFAALIFWFFVHRWLISLSFKTARIGGKIIWWLVTAIAIAPVLLTLLVVQQFAIREWSNNLGLGHLAILPALSLIAGYLAWRGLKPSRDGTATPIGSMLLRLRGIDGGIDEVTTTHQIVVPLYYITLAASLVLIAIAVLLHPVRIADYVYRAPMLPFLLGVFVAPLTYFSHWSVRSRAPLVVVGLIIGALVVFVSGDAHDIRTIPNALSRESFRQAVKRWAAVNGCDVTTKKNARACPAPFIISVAGGASRSAFHVAGVIGQLLDDRTLTVQKGHVRGAAFSPDGMRILTTASPDKAVLLWDGTTGDEIATLEGHEGPVKSAAFSLTGARIVTIAVEDKTARLWDGTTGQEIAALEGHENPVESAAFSSDGTRILTIAHEDKTARLWDGRTGQEIAALEGHEDPITIAVFSSDGTRIVTAAHDDKTARLWDGKTGEQIAALKGHEDPVESATFSPDGTRIITIGSDKIALLRDGKSGDQIKGFEGHRVENAAFSPDGTRIITIGREDKIALLWDGKTGDKIKALVGHEGSIKSAAFSADGIRIVTTAHEDKSARLWDGKTGAEINVLKGHEYRVENAAFSPDGARIVTTYFLGEAARLWNGATGDEIKVLEGDEQYVETIAFSPDGTRIITLYLDKAALLWDGTTGEKIKALEGHEGRVESATFSADGTRIVTIAYQDKTTRLWDGKTGKEIQALIGHENPLESVTFSPDGTRIFTISYDEAIGIWDGKSGSKIAVLKPYSETWRFQPFGKQLFAVSGVSGGSLGAAVAYAALADSQRKDRAINGIGSPPCKKGVPDTDWFAPSAVVHQRESEVSPRRPDTTTPVSPLEAQKSWRGCLQLLLAGDFISPVFVSLVMTDPIQYPRGRWGDRAAVLEQAWEMRYAKLTGQEENDSTLGKPLVALRKDVLQDEKNWLPVFITGGSQVNRGDRYQVKCIMVKPGGTLSLQSHHHRSEHWVVVKGTLEVTKGAETSLLSENQSTYIAIGEKHRLANPGKIPAFLIEVQSGPYLDEDDIIRFEDVYHRH